MIYLYLFGTCFHFIYVFMIIGKIPFGQNNIGGTSEIEVPDGNYLRSGTERYPYV